MLKHKIRNHSEEDARSQKSHYTNASKIGTIIPSSSKNVEVSLEVELDDEVKNLIRNPEGCSSTLLDVTVIKPKGLGDYSTNTQTLKSQEVINLLDSMNLSNVDKKNVMHKIFGPVIKPTKNLTNNTHHHHQQQPTKKSCLTSSRNKIKNNNNNAPKQGGDVRFNSDNSTTEENTKTPVQQIYTTPRTYENIRTMFACQNQIRQAENHKLDQPCLCHNCAIVGILTDSQKRPFATEPMPDPMEKPESRYIRRPSRKKSVSFKNLEELTAASNRMPHEQCNTIFNLLSVRINDLEKRLTVQEQKAVPRDYFKKIITKLVNQLSKLTHYTAEERNMSLHRESPHFENQRRDNNNNNNKKDYLAPHSKLKPERYNNNNKYYVNPVFVDNTFRTPAEKEFDPKPCSSSEPEAPRGPSETLWKWGEEFWSSGRELKNKVVLLLEDTIKNLRKNFEKPTPTGHTPQDDIQHIVEELSKNLAETIKCNSPRCRDANNKLLINNNNNNRAENPNKYSNICLNSAGGSITLKSRQDQERKLRKTSLNQRTKRRNNNNGPTINVAYINPELKKWPEESAVSFKIDSDYESHKDSSTMSEGKKNLYIKEFFKVLENTKTADKFKLWQSIWNQALENGQTKADTVTIQIPDPKDLLRQKMVHLEFTIRELERLLLKDQKT